MKTDLVYLRHILDCIVKIESYAAVRKEVFWWKDLALYCSPINDRLKSPSPFPAKNRLDGIKDNNKIEGDREVLQIVKIVFKLSQGIFL